MTPRLVVLEALALLFLLGTWMLAFKAIEEYMR